MHYHQPISSRILYAVFGGPLTAGTIAMILMAPWASFHQTQLTCVGVLLLFLLWGGIWLVTTALRFRLTLTPHAITLRRAFTTRTVARTDIAFYRKVRIPGGDPALFIFVRGKKRYGMRIPCVLKEEDAVTAWLDHRRD